MSVLTDVLTATRAGATPDAVARRLGLDQGLVDAAIDHWVRLGVVTSVCAGPRAPGAACAAATPACAGCPVAPRR
ncbi:hypothetical protein [Cellulomonas soli]